MLLICPCRLCRWTKSWSLSLFFLCFSFFKWSSSTEREIVWAWGGCVQAAILFQGMLLQTLLHFWSGIFKQVLMPACFSCCAQSKCRQQCFVIYNLWSLTALELWCFWRGLRILYLPDLNAEPKRCRKTSSSGECFFLQVVVELHGCLVAWPRPQHWVLPSHMCIFGEQPSPSAGEGGCHGRSAWLSDRVTPWNNPPLEPRPVEDPLFCQK